MRGKLSSLERRLSVLEGEGGYHQEEIGAALTHHAATGQLPSNAKLAGRVQDLAARLEAANVAMNAVTAPMPEHQPQEG